MAADKVRAKRHRPSRLDELDKLIPPPGHFLVVKKESLIEKRPKDEKNGAPLDFLKQPAVAKTVYAMYARCHNNAVDLLNEARLLFQTERYARAIALGISAWEELGKSQIAADYYSGILQDTDYKEAFK